MLRGCHAELMATALCQLAEVRRPEGIVLGSQSCKLTEVEGPTLQKTSLGSSWSLPGPLLEGAGQPWLLVAPPREPTTWRSTASATALLRHLCSRGPWPMRSHAYVESLINHQPSISLATIIKPYHC